MNHETGVDRGGVPLAWLLTLPAATLMEVESEVEALGRLQHDQAVQAQVLVLESQVSAAGTPGQFAGALHARASHYRQIAARYRQMADHADHAADLTAPRPSSAG